MAFQMSAQLSHIRAPTSTALVPRARAHYHSVGVKFKHFVTPGSLLPPKRPLHASAGAGTNFPASLNPGHIHSASRGRQLSTARVTFWRSGPGAGSSPRGKRGLLGRIAFGALGVTAAAVVSLHTGSLVAMAHKPNLDSAGGDWKETKDFLLSLSVEQRRQYYRTSNYETLDNVPVWTPTAGDSGQSRYPRNEKLDGKISLYSGDITKLEIDAIVNAANNTLLGGGGVDGAIHRAAGPKLKQECASLHGCETGQAKITCGYGLPAKYVIHTVGPIATGGVGEQERRALRSCYRNSLETATASQNAVRSLAFPCISTGIYGYPPEQAVHEVLATVREYLDEHHDKLDRVIFCVFLPTDKELYLKNLPLYFPGTC
ncbi:ADP-ribose glycohydrolase MACROD1 isoform X2 [Myripristis murdjan]|uniref:ADP-ribose glycohydrolase MACROD1 isoform X2 n=1 Tax=Myripristis murdjan TaxID=586833 RepID=UPI001175DF92|nr:ADP-ribose glycohydrolase MACROD1 isoform X2 [Myripristis murdjan]